MKASKKTNSVINPTAVKLQKNDFSLPSHDALAQILPQDLMGEAETELQREGHRKQKTPNPYKTHPSLRRASLPVFEDDPQLAKVTNLQTQELENYRAAMNKMAEDIILLRTQMVALEAENSQLRSDMSLHQDLGRDLLTDTDIDVMTKAEMSDRINTLKLKLASETSKTVAQRDRIQQLQNELIKKNDSEKELLKLQRIQRQQDERQHRVAEVAALEATVKQQGKVIEKMEKALESKLRESRGQREDRRLVVKKHRGEISKERDQIEAALAAENARLREELDRIRLKPPTVIIQQMPKVKDGMPLKERMRLLSELEKAEARVRTLEAQLEENSRGWGRQKQDMLNKLSEQRLGFDQTSTLHRVSTVR